MAMVSVVSGSLYRWTHSLSRLAWSWVGGHLAPFYIHQINRVNSRTINIVLVIIIFIIIKLVVIVLQSNAILTALLPPTKEEVNVFAHVRLSVCLLARLLKNACVDLDEMLHVDRCRDMDELINF